MPQGGVDPNQAERKPLSASHFLVLALLAEGEAHGYKLERMAKQRGLRYWADVGRSSIYQALKHLEREGLASSRLAQGEGPSRKVFRITDLGSQTLSTAARTYLAAPAPPRSDLDLGIYALPFLEPQEAKEALDQGRKHLQARADFLEERLKWCRERGLKAAALNFERPFLALRAELMWLYRVQREQDQTDSEVQALDWQAYEDSAALEPDQD
jgi:DNA-binding PadR family transcriptional regulator